MNKRPPIDELDGPEPTSRPLLAVLGLAIVVAAYTGFRVPNVWSATLQAVSLFDGFHRRFVVGTLLHPFALLTEDNYWMFATFSYLVPRGRSRLHARSRSHRSCTRSRSSPSSPLTRTAQMDIPFSYESAGTTFAGQLYSAGPTGILVLHGGTGVTDHERGVARRLVELGYTAFVPDLFGGPFTSREHGLGVIGELVAQPAKLRARLADALAALRTRVTEAAAIGYCFGGLAALELARSGADVACVVSFHGGLQCREPGRIATRVLACTGAADPFVPREHRLAFEDEMTAAGASWQLHVYGGAQHGFTEHATRPGCAYDATADRQSWAAMVELLQSSIMRISPPP